MRERGQREPTVPLYGPIITHFWISPPDSTRCGVLSAPHQRTDFAENGGRNEKQCMGGLEKSVGDRFSHATGTGGSV